MSDSKISGLPVDSSPSYTDLVPIVTGNTTSQITAGNLVAAGSGVVPANPKTPWMCHPQGRLSSSNSTPVTGGGAGLTVIYYVPYQGIMLPIYNGTMMLPFTVNNYLTFNLNATAHTNGNLYDVFAFSNSGVVTLGAGPAWTNTTTRSASITQVAGLWVNSAAINLTNGSTTYNGIAANQATYLGTFYTTANGQTSQSLFPNGVAGGTGNILGIYNAYNQVLTGAYSNDISASWTTSSGSFVVFNGNNLIKYIDGLGFSYCISYGYALASYTAASFGFLAINFNGTVYYDQQSNNPMSASQANSPMSVGGPLPNSVGLNVVNLVAASGSGGTNFLWYIRQYPLSISVMI